MQTLTTFDLRLLGYPECYISPLDNKLFEVVPTTHKNWELWPYPRAGSTGNDVYKRMVGDRTILSAAGLPTLALYASKPENIPESWIGSRIFGLGGVVVHRDNDHVAPYLDCRDVTQIYVGFFRLRCNLDVSDAFIFLP